MRNGVEIRRLSIFMLVVLILFIGTSLQAIGSADSHSNLRSIPSPAGQGQTSEILLQDNFTRPDSTSLGMPWTERNEITSEFIPLGGAPVGPGFIELNSGSLTFHYINHSLRAQFPFTSSHARPVISAPLTHSVSSFPVEFFHVFPSPRRAYPS